MRREIDAVIPLIVGEGIADTDVEQGFVAVADRLRGPCCT